jgi:hypothetical protein
MDWRIASVGIANSFAAPGACAALRSDQTAGASPHRGQKAAAPARRTFRASQLSQIFLSFAPRATDRRFFEPIYSAGC